MTDPTNPPDDPHTAPAFSVDDIEAVLRQAAVEMRRRRQVLRDMADAASAAGIDVMEVSVEEFTDPGPGKPATITEFIADMIAAGRQREKLYIFATKETTPKNLFGPPIEPRQLPPGHGRIATGDEPPQRVGTHHADPASMRATLAMMGERPTDITPAEADAITCHGVTPPVFRRLNPAVTGPAVDTFTERINHLRDRVVPLLRGHPDAAVIAGDITAEGYRVAVHRARRDATDERARRALMFLELALTNLAVNRTQLADSELRSCERMFGI